MAGLQSAEQFSSNRSHDDEAEKASDEQSAKVDATQSNTPLPKRVWEKSGLNVGMLVMMFKGALPPTIAIALYQSAGFAETYSTLGYLVAIMSILSFAIMPRAKFFQTMSFNIISICIGSCVALLTIYCSVQARAHTTPPIPSGPKSSSGGPSPGASVAPYNSSASAVCAIWLFFNIYVSNTLRASRPQLQFPVIMYSIFANVASTYAPQFATMVQGIAFTKRLLEAFLTGFGIASAVSLLIFPFTSRTVVFNMAAGYIGALRAVLRAQSRYLESLESKDVFKERAKNEGNTPEKDHEHHHFHHRKRVASKLSAEAQALKAAVATVAELHGKINADAPFAKRELAYGKLDASDISELIKLMQQILLPVIGMSSVADIFNRLAESRGWSNSSTDDSDKPRRSHEVEDKEISQWNDIMRTLHHPFKILTEAMDQGLEHVLLTLELAERPRTKRGHEPRAGSNRALQDVEANGEAIQPGDRGFADAFSAKIDRFYEQRSSTLNTWCTQHGIELEREQYKGKPPSSPVVGVVYSDHERQQRRLYLILYVSREFII